MTTRFHPAPARRRGARGTALIWSLLAGLAVGCQREVMTLQEAEVEGQPARLEVAREDHERLAGAAGLAFGTMSGILQQLDPVRPESDINKLNRVAGTVRFQVSRPVFRLLDLGHHYAGLSGGSLDLTAYPLEKAWGLEGPQPEEEPSEELLKALRAGVGRDFVQVFDQGAVAFTSPNTQLRLGRLGDAYAVDLAILELRRAQLAGARLQRGDFQRAIGRAAPDRPWTTPVPHPFQDRAVLGQLALEGAQTALAVLRLHHPALRIGDQVYGGVLDPRSGRPAAGTALAAVTGPSATLAAALAQALLVAGLEQAPELLRTFPKCEALVVPDAQPAELWMTPGWAQHFAAEPDLAGHTRPLERAANRPDPDESAPPEPEP